MGLYCDEYALLTPEHIAIEINSESYIAYLDCGHWHWRCLYDCRYTRTPFSHPDNRFCLARKGLAVNWDDYLTHGPDFFVCAISALSDYLCYNFLITVYTRLIFTVVPIRDQNPKILDRSFLDRVLHVRFGICNNRQMFVKWVIDSRLSTTLGGRNWWVETYFGIAFGYWSSCQRIRWPCLSFSNS